MKDLLLTTLKDTITPLLHWENHRQLDKWGVQDHDRFTWYTILGEEVGELAQAILEYEHGDGGIDSIVKEAIQVATVAIKLAEMNMEDKWPSAEDMCRNILGELSSDRGVAESCT